MIALVCRHPETKRMVAAALCALKTGPLELILADQSPRLSELGECCSLAIVGTEIGEAVVQQIPRYLRGNRCIRTTPTIMLFDPRSTMKLGSAGTLGYDDFAELPLSAQELSARLGLLLGRGARRRQTLSLSGLDLATGLLDSKRVTPALTNLLERGRARGAHLLGATIRFDGALELERTQGSGAWAAFMSQMAAEILGSCQTCDIVAWGAPDRILVIREDLRADDCRPWLDALAARLRPRAPESTAKIGEGDSRREFTIGAVSVDLSHGTPGLDTRSLLSRFEAALTHADSTQTKVALLQGSPHEQCQAA